MRSIAAKRVPIRIALIIGVLALLTPARGPAAVALEVRVLSDRADLITSGDALVEVVIPNGVATRHAAPAAPRTLPATGVGGWTLAGAIVLSIAVCLGATLRIGSVRRA